MQEWGPRVGIVGVGGARLDWTYQLNFRGNADLRNMLERLQSKAISKSPSMTSQLRMRITSENLPGGPNEPVPWLTIAGQGKFSRRARH